MGCKKFELTASAYLDRQLTLNQTSEYRAHLSTCENCCVDLAEVEQLSLALRRAKQPEAPLELRSYVMTAVARRRAGDISLGQRAFEWLLKLNPRPISYAAGALVSALLFGVLMPSLRPLPAIGASAEQIFPVVYSSDREYHNYNNLPPDIGLNGSDHYYQLPRVLDNSALVSFSHIAYQKQGNEGMAALVEVGLDGRARLVDVMGEADPYMVEQLWWSLSKRTFQPASVAGRPVPTRIVLLVEKVDVGG